MQTLQLRRGLPRTLPRIYLGDTWLLIMAAILTTFGLIMMTSASVEIASSQYGDPFYHFKRQVVFLFLGLGFAGIVLTCPMRYWYKSSVALLALA
jgi:cell division protein FtsW